MRLGGSKIAKHDHITGHTGFFHLDHVFGREQQVLQRKERYGLEILVENICQYGRDSFLKFIEEFRLEVSIISLACASRRLEIAIENNFRLSASKCQHLVLPRTVNNEWQVCTHL